MGHSALQHSPGVRNGVACSPALNVTFVEGIIGQFIQCDNEKKQKSGIRREKRATNEQTRYKHNGRLCVCACVCVMSGFSLKSPITVFLLKYTVV